MSNVIQPPVSVQQPTINYIDFDIISVQVVLNTKAIVIFCMYDETKTKPLSQSLILEGDAYSAWGNDDNYIIVKVQECIQSINALKPQA